MLGAALKHPLLVVAAAATRPLETWTRLQDARVFRREQRRAQCQYEAEENWERRMHDLLGLTWPCNFSSEFWALWPEVLEPLKAKGIRVGPSSFKQWNDGDPGLVRAIWCLIRHLRPNRVVETGVARGFTSRFILEALERNGSGRLWSIDLPPMDPLWQEQVGMAVGNSYRHRWSYIRGPSRLRLSELLIRLGQIDLFVHDSLHSERNVRFELDRVWKVLTPGGVAVVDDVDVNWGFRSFMQNVSGNRTLICEAEPLQPDLRRFNKKGLFGIILKESAKF
jgi:Methyltransferase domain